MAMIDKEKLLIRLDTWTPFICFVIDELRDNGLKDVAALRTEGEKFVEPWIEVQSGFIMIYYITRVDKTNCIQTGYALDDLRKDLAEWKLEQNLTVCEIECQMTSLIRRHNHQIPESVVEKAVE